MGNRLLSAVGLIILLKIVSSRHSSRLIKECQNVLISRLRTLSSSRHLNKKNCASLLTDSEVDVQEFTISSISDANSDDSWFVIVYIDGTSVKFK